MTHAERFCALMDFKPVDRLPMVEWATWWDLTIARWEQEGLPLSRTYSDAKNRDDDLYLEISRHFGLDLYQHQCFWASWARAASPGANIITDEADYEAVHGDLFPSNAQYQFLFDRLAKCQASQDRGDSLLRLSFYGFFALPRVLFGDEQHFYAFYDYPDLMHRINRENAEFMIRILHQACKVCKPVFLAIGEDMSYNNGPMLSKALFDEFLAPYYRKVIPVMKELGIRVLVDSDGDANELLLWLAEVGVEGLLPMERNAGSDAVATRKKLPHFLMIGNFEKLLMTKGETAVRAEFERLLPVMKQGGFIPSPDHQTPPQVSLEQYRTYIRLLKEYSIAGVPSRRSTNNK